MASHIARNEVIRRLRDAGFHFSSTHARVEIYRRSSDKQRVNVFRRDLLPVGNVRVILAQAGLSGAEIDRFVKDAIKQDC